MGYQSLLGDYGFKPRVQKLELKCKVITYKTPNTLQNY